MQRPAATGRWQTASERSQRLSRDYVRSANIALFEYGSLLDL